MIDCFTLYRFFFQDFTEYVNFEECLKFIEDLMIQHGPFDGLMGFSQVNYIVLNCEIDQNNRRMIVDCETYLLDAGGDSNGGAPGDASEGDKYPVLYTLIIEGFLYHILICARSPLCYLYLYS